jgi:hypothetical protein
VVSTQKYRAISPVIRVNGTELYIWRLRNASDLDAWVEEVSATANKKDLLEMYNEVTSIPFGLLYIKLTAHDTDHMFYQNFSKRFVLTE